MTASRRLVEIFRRDGGRLSESSNAAGGRGLRGSKEAVPKEALQDPGARGIAFAL
jgi:hypothetical protein